MDPRARAASPQTSARPRRGRVPQRMQAKTRRKSRNPWLKKLMTCGCTSPQSIEKIGYSLMVFAIVRVLPQRTSNHASPIRMW